MAELNWFYSDTLSAHILHVISCTGKYVCVGLGCVYVCVCTDRVGVRVHKCVVCKCVVCKYVCVGLGCV